MGVDTILRELLLVGEMMSDVMKLSRTQLRSLGLAAPKGRE